ncbi:hypothetical protein HII31_11288, partial [Pseudocercospora fuligena]
FATPAWLNVISCFVDVPNLQVSPDTFSAKDFASSIVVRNEQLKSDGERCNAYGAEADLRPDNVTKKPRGCILIDSDQQAPTTSHLTPLTSKLALGVLQRGAVKTLRKVAATRTILFTYKTLYC